MPIHNDIILEKVVFRSQHIPLDKRLYNHQHSQRPVQIQPSTVWPGTASPKGHM